MVSWSVTALDWLVGGVAIGIAGSLAANALRKAYIRRRIRRMWEKTPLIRKLVSSSGTPGTQVVKKRQRKNDGKTDKILKKETLEEREAKLSDMLGEMRELILHLTEIIARTNSATGEASERFDEAKLALEHLEMDAEDSDISLSHVRFLLLTEIDRMVQSNATLKKQLVAAETGIHRQKQEIDKLKTKARIDPLTQLFNRAAFDDLIQEAFNNWKRSREVFSLLMLDVDHFKDINDTHGHLHGDRILKEIAGKIREGVRDKDYASRYGGEEFAVILSDTQSEEALAVGTRIREAIERSHFQVDSNPLHITISGGIAQAGTSNSAVDIIDIADKALYRSKKRGRNRITLGEDTIRESWTSGEGR